MQDRPPVVEQTPRQQRIKRGRLAQLLQAPDVTPKVRSGPIAAQGLRRCGGTWRCLVRRDIHAPHLRADAMPRTPELALASACARHLTPTPPLLRR